VHCSLSPLHYIYTTPEKFVDLSNGNNTHVKLAFHIASSNVTEIQENAGAPFLILLIGGVFLLAVYYRQQTWQLLNDLLQGKFWKKDNKPDDQKWLPNIPMSKSSQKGISKMKSS